LPLRRLDTQHQKQHRRDAAAGQCAEEDRPPSEIAANKAYGETDEDEGIAKAVGDQIEHVTAG